MPKQLREPSIHISETNLKKVLRSVGVKCNDTQVNMILIEAKKYQLSNRKILANNQRQLKKTNNILKSPMEQSSKMAELIYYKRKALKHRGIEIITPGHKDWNFIKTITANAIEFYNEFGKGTMVESFKEYIEQAIKQMTDRFSLPKFQYAHPKIMSDYESYNAINNDPFKPITDQAYKCYNAKVIDQTGFLFIQYDKDPSKYKYFVQVAKVCNDMGIQPKDYIIAQFEGLAWRNGIPEPEHLVGDKAKERLQKYLFENKIEVVKNTKTMDKDWVNKLKQLK